MQIWIVAAMMALQAAEPASVPAPPPPRHYVVDEAGLLEGASIRLIDSIGVWRERAGMPLYVLTIRSLAAHDSSDATFESYARRAFDAWRKTRPGADRAAMLIVSEEDKQARIEIGEGWGREHDPAIQLVMEDAIEPAMARGSLAQGIVAASYEITWALKPPTVSTWMQDVLMAAGVVLAGILVLALLRRMKRAAPTPAPVAPRPAAEIDPKLRVSQRMQSISEARAKSEKAASSIAWLDTGEMPKLDDPDAPPAPVGNDDEG